MTLNSKHSSVGAVDYGAIANAGAGTMSAIAAIVAAAQSGKNLDKQLKLQQEATATAQAQAAANASLPRTVAKSNTGLYVGIGVVGIILVGGIIYVVKRK